MNGLAYTSTFLIFISGIVNARVRDPSNLTRLIVQYSVYLERISHQLILRTSPLSFFVLMKTMSERSIAKKEMFCKRNILQMSLENNHLGSGADIFGHDGTLLTITLNQLKCNRTFTLVWHRHYQSSVLWKSQL